MNGLKPEEETDPMLSTRITKQTRLMVRLRFHEYSRSKVFDIHLLPQAVTGKNAKKAPARMETNTSRS